jgi:crossover junction endodeoxyribonuclease RuvC
MDDPKSNDPTSSGKTRRTIVGIDPGLNTTGYGVLELTAGGVRLVEAGVIRCGSSNVIELRLQEIYRGVSEVVEAFQPTAIAIEELYSHYDRPRTAILMGHARGVICLAAAGASVPVVHYAATQVKRLLTGSGRAPKSQMQLAVCRELGLAKPPDPPDVADALAIALCHHFLSKGQIVGLRLRDSG